MTEKKQIKTSGPINASIRPPGSKSITNRALVCAAMADGKSELHGCLDSEDTRVMVDCLSRLGVQIESHWPEHRLTVFGTGGRIPAKHAELHVANSGTTIRFLTALVAAGHGEFVLDGIPRMRERPIGDLLDALQQLGVEVTADEKGCPPVQMNSSGLEGGVAHIKGSISSQYLSGLLMASPLGKKRIRLEVDGELVSKPYVEMTQQVMGSFGIKVTHHGLANTFETRPQTYQPQEFWIEPDASAASYFWAAAAITGGKVKVEGLTKKSLQGDVDFCECLVSMGCALIEEPKSLTILGQPLTGIDVNMNSISDTVQTLAAVALFADGPTTIRGVAHNRHKETDRIGDLAHELRKVGAEVEEFEDGMTITPQPLQSAELDTYNDHRMAMSLSLIGLRQPGIVIKNPGCTVKTYPDFFDDLEKLIAS